MSLEVDEKQSTDESSPSGTIAVEETQPVMAVEDLSSAQRSKWLESGKLPPQVAKKEEKSPTPEKEEKVTEKEESSPSEEPEKVEVAEKEKVAEPAPAAKTQEKVEIPPHEARIKELLAKNKILEKRLATRELPPTVKPPEKIEEEPKAEDFEDIGKYLDAKVKYEVAQDRRARDEEQARIQVDAKNREIVEKWNNAVIEAKKKYPDFEEKCFSENFKIVEGSVLDRWCLESDRGTDVLHHYATHPDEFAALNRMLPMAAAIEIARTEVKLLEKPKPAPKLVSDAPKPPSEVSGRGTATDDPSAEALASGDMQKYMRLENAKERAQFVSRK